VAVELMLAVTLRLSSRLENTVNSKLSIMEPTPFEKLNMENER